MIISRLRSGKIRRFFFIALQLTLCLVFIFPAVASAHAILLRSDPAKDASYNEAIYTYDTTAETPPPLKRYELWRVEKGNLAARKKVSWSEFTEYAPSPPFPDEDFRLTAFGFPEPVGVKWPKPTPPYVWVLVAAGVAVGVVPDLVTRAVFGGQ